MYSAKEVARYIIDYSYDRKRLVSNLRVQKILYFVQCEFLMNYGKPCFKESIHAWHYGPVVPEVYYEYRMFGPAVIPSMGTKSQEYRILENDMKTIREVVDECNQYTTTQLVDLTHVQDPWKKAYQKNEIITNKSIIDYFSEE